jgi:hypothetical protein
VIGTFEAATQPAKYISLFVDRSEPGVGLW